MKCLLLVLFYHLVLSRVIVSVFAGGADDASSRLGVLFARTDTGRDFTPKKCARKNISLCEWCDGVVSRRTCRTFRTFDMFWKGFRTRRMKRAGACWTRERDSARFADGRNFCLKKGLSVCSSLGKSSSLSRIPRVLSSVLSLPLTRVRSGLFSQQRRTMTKRVCVHPFTISADKTFSFSLNRVSISKLAAATKRRSALRKSPKTSTWRCW